MKGLHTLTLKVCIPMLAKKVPHGWIVSLVDNPGFGEAKEHVTQIADASIVTSSAYIYLLQTENIGGKEAAEFFKELNEKDPGKILKTICHRRNLNMAHLVLSYHYYFR